MLLSEMHLGLDVCDTNRSGNDHDQVKQPKQKLEFYSQEKLLLRLRKVYES